MSNPAGESVTPRSRPGGRALLSVLILTPLVSIALSVLLVLSILHFLAGVPSSAVARGTVADPQLLRDIVEPFRQHGTVPVKQFGGMIYYPIPYATPPHLTLTAKAAERSYAIVRQDEFGFVWAVDVGLKEFKDLAGALKGTDLKDVVGAFTGLEGKVQAKLLPSEEFTWEARGVRPFTTEAAIPPFAQHEVFNIPAREGHEGVEYFLHPYVTPPNLALSSTSVKIVVTTATGFRWQSIGFLFSVEKVTWTAKGVRATPAQVAELAKNPPRFGNEQIPVVDDRGSLAYNYGEQGAVSFTRPFASPPNVQVENVIVTEITPQGFRWKHPGTRQPNSNSTFNTIWTAKGVPDLTIGKKHTK